MLNPDIGFPEVVRRTIVGIDGHRLLLERRHDNNYWLELDANASLVFPILTGCEADDVVVENIVLDGARNDNANINGNYAGGVFCQDCHRWRFKQVISRNYNGDGFSFQRCDDWTFESCVAERNAGLGFHPGSGSQRPRLIDCQSARNDEGVFFCWGVTDGRVENCDLSDNETYGATIGHRDTDNHLIDCRLERNGTAGLRFRPNASHFRGGHRNLIERCRIADNGADADGVGIDFDGPADEVRIVGCHLLDTGAGRQRIGVRLNHATGVVLEDNRYDNLQEDVALR